MDIAVVKKKYSNLPPSWFQFLLNHSLVVEHLTRLDSHFAEPSACQMLSIFLEKACPAKCTPESAPVGESQFAPALRSMALYVACWIKWNLSQIMSSTSFVTQLALLDCLKAKAGIDPSLAFTASDIEPRRVMSHVIYARWIVRAMTIHLSRSSKVPESCIANIEQAAASLSPLLPYAVDVLQCAISNLDQPTPLPEAELSGVETTGGGLAPLASLHCQLCLELGFLLFHQGRFTAACSRFQQATELRPSVPSGDWLCSVDDHVLDAYLIACLQVTEFPPSVLEAAGGSPAAKLVTRVEQCRKHCMQGVDAVLLDSDAPLSIPVSYKRDLEDGLAATANRSAATTQGQASAAVADPEMSELHWRVCVSNAVHSVLLSQPVSPSFWLAWRQADSTHHFTVLLDACGAYLENGSANRRSRLVDFAKSVALSSKNTDSCWSLLQRHVLAAECLAADPAAANPLLVKKEPEELQVGGQFPWDKKGNSSSLERHILSSSYVDEMRSLIQDLQQNPASMARLGISDWWARDRHNNHLLSVLLAKAQHLHKAKAWQDTEQMLRTAWQLAETVRVGPAKNDVIRRLSDSQLGLDIQKYLAIQQNDQQRFNRLVRGTKDFLSKASTAVAALSNPLLEVCSLFLINIKEWVPAVDLLHRIDLSRASKVVQVCHALVITSLAVSAGGGPEPRKSARVLFDVVCDLLARPTQHKRTNDGLVKDSMQRSKEAEAKRSTILEVAQKLTDPLALSVLISCLVRINSALQLHEAGDGSDGKIATKTVEISCQYPVIWPVAVNNPSSMSRTDLLPIVGQVLDHCLATHANHAGFVCSMADLLLGTQQYSASLQRYLQLGAAHSNFFSVPVPSDIWPDQVYHNMIACCQGLSAFSQAIVLCQMLSHVDYKTANRCIQQASCHDAMEVYYDCVWDHAILEFAIHTHAMREEDEKRKQAVSAMSHLDLNQASSAETCRKAAQLRLTTFLRRMAAVYI